MVLPAAPTTPTLDLREEEAGSAAEGEDEPVHIELEGDGEEEGGGEEDEEEDYSGEGKATKKAHLSRDDYRIIVSWMELSDNYKAIHGTGEKTKVGEKVKKSDGFVALVKHLKKNTSTVALQTWTARNMEQRWRTYMRRFKKTLKRSQSTTGVGLTKQELARGMSFQEKLERKCPEFTRMKDLFAEKANITPSSTLELGVPLLVDSGNLHGRSEASQEFDLSFAVDASPYGDICSDSSFVPAAQTQILPDATPTQQTSVSSQNPTPSGSTTMLAPQATQPERSFSRYHSTPKAKTGKRSCPASKRAEQQSSPKYAKTSDGKPNRSPRPANAHETRMSLSAAYAKNAEAKVDYLKQKLEKEYRQWNEKQEAAELQREAEAQQRAQEQEERRSQRKQESSSVRASW
jgi:hypothetical protein